MDIAGILTLSIPIVAICAVFGVKALKVLLLHQQTIETIRAQRDARAADTSVADIEALRRELRELRETSTQHALSLQSLLETLDQRVDHLEAQSRASAPATTASENTETVLRAGQVRE
ncbi:MAG: hypothetical protein P4L33_16020 [Capsulimonadaceae bacterium]|nr:hypothetical protein [Capsulimonadaceae bacterium]